MACVSCGAAIGLGRCEHCQGTQLLRARAELGHHSVRHSWTLPIMCKAITVMNLAALSNCKFEQDPPKVLYALRRASAMEEQHQPVAPAHLEKSTISVSSVVN